jgi:outer membrane murein-binding lipoprotein Lpp
MMSDELVERLTGKRAMNGSELRQATARIQSLTQQVKTLTAERDCLEHNLEVTEAALTAWREGHGEAHDRSLEELCNLGAALKETNHGD